MTKTITLGPDPFITSDENEADARDILFAGRWSVPPIPDNRQAEFVLDMDPDEGAFACWAYMRFGGPWIDCLQNPKMPVADLGKLRSNVPPSARLILEVSERMGYDVIHAGHLVNAGLAALEQCPTCIWYGAEWNTEGDRIRIDMAATARGMRLFKIELRDASAGRGLWIKSQAVWNGHGYEMPPQKVAA